MVMITRICYPDPGTIDELIHGKNIGSLFVVPEKKSILDILASVAGNKLLTQ